MVRLALLIILAISASAAAQEGRTRSRQLFSFENGTDTARLLRGAENVDLIVVQDNGVTDGKNCARLTARKGSAYSVLKLDAESIRNWGDFDYFAIDVFAEDEHPYTLNLELWDADSKNYPTRCTFSEVKTRAGRQTLLYPIGRAKRNNKEGRTWDELEAKDKISLNGLKQVKLFLTPLKDRDAVLWIDNLRLLQEDAAKPKLRVPLPEGAIAFNFGSAGTSVPGFQAVSPKTSFAKNGFGFADGAEVQHGGDGWPDLISGTFVSAPEGRGLQFTAKVPNGEYQLWLCAGPIHLAKPTSFTYSLRVNGQIITDVRLRPEEYFGEKYLYRFMNTPYSEKPHALWENYIDKMYPVHNLKVKVESGLLQIDATNYFLSAAVLLPAAAKSDFVDATRKLRIEAFEKTLPPARPRTSFTPADGSDVAVWVPDPFAVIRPASAPAKEDAARKSIAIAGAPGQRVVARVAFKPKSDLDKCTLQLSDLTGPGTIGAKSIRGYRQGYRFDGETLGEMALIPQLEANGEAGIAKCFWLWMEIPADARAGKYQSKFILKAAAIVQEIPVELEVYPFKLETILPVSFGMYYSPRKPEQLPEATVKKLVEGQFRFMREVGFTSVPIGVPTVTGLGKGDAVNMKFDSSLVDLAKEAGFGRHPKQYLTGGTLGIGRAIGRRLPGSQGALVDRQPGIELKQPQFRDYFRNALSQYAGWAEKCGAPIAVEVVDEPREVPNPWNRNLADTLAYAKMVRDAGLRGYITPMGDNNGGKDYTAIADETDIVSVHAYKASQGLMKRTREKGKALWIYNTGMDRYSWGFYNWRAGSEGRWEWHFCWPEDMARGGYSGREWFNPFTASHGMACDAPITLPGGIVFASAFLDVCEGINDMAYIVTLEKSIERCEKAGRHGAATKSAGDFLAALKRAIPEFPQTRGLASGADGALIGAGIDDESRLQTPQWRAKIADYLRVMATD